jgi:hypothetical protein
MKVPTIALMVVAGALMILGGCTHPSHTLSPLQAAQLAAQLANDECERRYHKRPFTPEQHVAVQEGERFRWGGLNEGAPKGLSALVTFRPDGNDPVVEVYFSTDVHLPKVPNPTLIPPGEFPPRPKR